jgi:hypothetical protein
MGVYWIGAMRKDPEDAALYNVLATSIGGRTIQHSRQIRKEDTPNVDVWVVKAVRGEDCS